MANSSIKNLNIDGNVVISGSTTSVDVATVTVDDNNITLNDITSPLDSNADGGGVTIKGTTDKIFSWVDATDSWTSSVNINIIGTDYKIGSTSVLNATTLGSGIVNSSLTNIGILTALQVDTVVIDGTQIGLTTDTDLITLTNDTVTVAGTVATTAITGDGSGLTGISTTNIDSPGADGDFIISSGATGWAGLTPPITVALGGTGAADAATARTNLGVTATGTDTTYAYRANNLNDVANVATARTNLGITATGSDTTYAYRANNLNDVADVATARTNLELGTTDSPSFGGEGTGFININATPSSGGTVAPTFAGTIFKNIPIAAGSGHKWVHGIEQDGDLSIGYFTINDAGANTSAVTTYYHASPSTNTLLLGSPTGTVSINTRYVFPSADGAAGELMQTDGAGTLSFVTASSAGALTIANNLSDLANAATARTNLGVANTDNIAEGTNEYWTTTKFDTRFVTKGINSLADATITSAADDEVLVYDSGTSKWVNETLLTTKVDEGTNLYYTDARVDAYINASITTDDVSEGANLYYTDARWNTKMTAADTGDLSEGSNLYYTNARADARITAADTGDLSEGSNLYYTNARADARIALADISDLADVHTAAPTEGDVLAWDTTNSRWEPHTHQAIILANDINETHIDWGAGANQVSTADVPENTNLYYTDARWDTKLAAADTGDLSEGSNLYYTDARVDTYINASITTDDVSEGANLYYTDARWDTKLAAADTGDLSEGSNLYYTDARADARIALAGSANWNTAYADTNAATSSDTSSTIVKRDATGAFSAGEIEATDGLVLGTTTATTTGILRWSGTDFQGHNGSGWQSLTGASVAQISGTIATIATTQTISNTTYVDIPGYTTAITVTSSNIINIQVNVDLAGPASNETSNVKLVRVVSGTPTDLYIDESQSATAGGSDHFNITYADTHGQANGAVITYKLMAKVTAGTLTVNPDGTNAQIFLQEITTSAVSVTSVNGASGAVVLDTDDIAEGSSNLYFPNDYGSVV